MSRRGQAGFTLVEIMLVLAVLGILVVVVLPNVAGVISRARGDAWDVDQRAIQAAVDSYNSDYRTGAGPATGGGAGFASSAYPTLDGSKASTATIISSGCTLTISAGSVTTKTGSCIDFTLLTGTGTARTYLREAPKSAGILNRIGTALAGTGTYTWYVGSDGLVRSTPAKIENVYP